MSRDEARAKPERVLAPSTGRDALLSAVYDELRALAAARMVDERPDHTLQPTALVHEAYLRLLDQDRVEWQNSTHFKAVAAIAMRRVLIDHARKYQSKSRGGGGRGSAGVAPEPRRCRVDLDRAVIELEQQSAVDLIALDEVLTRLEQEQPRWSKVVELRFFGGLSVAETATALGVSDRTVELDWRAARAWLSEVIEPTTGGEGPTAPTPA